MPGENAAFVAVCSTSKSDMFRGKGRPSELRLDVDEADGEETTDIVGGDMGVAIGMGEGMG